MLTLQGRPCGADAEALSLAERGAAAWFTTKKELYDDIKWLHPLTKKRVILCIVMDKIVVRIQKFSLPYHYI